MKNAALILVLTTTVGLLLSSCGSRGPTHRLGDYNFAGHTLAVVPIPAPSPELSAGGVSGRGALGTLIAAGARAAVEVEGRQARGRLDSASTRVDIAGRMSERTLQRSSAYLAASPVTEREGADFLMEVEISSLVIDASGRQAVLVLAAEAILLDGRTGREIWSALVRNRGPITPDAGAAGRLVPGQAITAAVLNTVTVEEFERILERAADMSADWISGQLREDLREGRR